MQHVQFLGKTFGLTISIGTNVIYVNITSVTLNSAALVCRTISIQQMFHLPALLPPLPVLAGREEICMIASGNQEKELADAGGDVQIVAVTKQATHA